MNKNIRVDDLVYLGDIFPSLGNMNTGIVREIDFQLDFPYVIIVHENDFTKESFVMDFPEYTLSVITPSKY